MEKISSLMQLNDIMGPYLKRRHITNNFTLPAAYSSMIEEDRLFYIQNDGLFLLVDMDNYYRFYYHLNDAETRIKFSADKPVVAEIAFPQGKMPQEIENECLVRSGFSIVLKRVRMKNKEETFSFKKHGSSNNIMPQENPRDYTVEEADMERWDQVSALLDKNFDKLTGFLPSQKDLEKSIIEGEVFCAIAGDKQEKSLKNKGEVQGILHIDIVNKTSNLLHIAVVEHARKRGIGEALLEKWREVASARGALKYILWVGEENFAAHKMYETAGFSMDGWSSFTLVYDAIEKGVKL